MSSPINGCKKKTLKQEQNHVSYMLYRITNNQTRSSPGPLLRMLMRCDVSNILPIVRREGLPGSSNLKKCTYTH